MKQNYLVIWSFKNGNKRFETVLHGIDELRGALDVISELDYYLISVNLVYETNSGHSGRTTNP